MNAEIAAIHARMAQGGDWFTFREEIARLHKEAKTQNEFVTLLEAHRILVGLAEHCFAPEKCAELRQFAFGEYMMFLNLEAMENEMINPVMLDRITAREVESGRLAPDDGFRTLASAGVLFGDSADHRYDRKLGNGIAILGLVAAIIAFLLFGAGLAVGVFLLGLIAGWVINEHKRKEALQAAKSARSDRGYGQ